MNLIFSDLGTSPQNRHKVVIEKEVFHCLTGPHGSITEVLWPKAPAGQLISVSCIGAAAALVVSLLMVSTAIWRDVVRRREFAEKSWQFPDGSFNNFNGCSMDCYSLVYWTIQHHWNIWKTVFKSGHGHWLPGFLLPLVDQKHLLSFPHAPNTSRSVIKYLYIMFFLSYLFLFYPILFYLILSHRLSFNSIYLILFYFILPYLISYYLIIIFYSIVSYLTLSYLISSSLILF